MLTPLQQAFRSERNVLAYISLALVGLMWVFPFLHYRHLYPITTFDQEWWSAVLGLFALTLLLARDYWQQPQIPRIAQFPIALIGVLLVQMLLGKVAYFDQGLLYILYLLFAGLLMLLGARLRECLGLERVAVILAVCLLVGAEAQAVIAVLQHYRWHTWFDGMVVGKVSAGVFGNIAQPNHFANYVSLGLASLGLLLQQRHVKVAVAIPLVVPLLFVMTLSGSRSSWLYLVMMTTLAAWMAYRHADFRLLFRYCLSLIAGFALMHGVVQLPFMAGADSINTMQRIFGEAADGSIRGYLWHEAWLIFQQSPWLGSGFGQFAWQHFQLQPVLRPDNIVGLYNNAHNVIFQIAAEAGIAGLLVLFSTLAIWLLGQRRATPSAALWWGYATLGVLAIHSLLEYPLWYTYFVAIAAILLGMFDETRYRLELRAVGRFALLAIIVLGLLIMMQLWGGYRRLEHTFAIRPLSANDNTMMQRITSELIKVSQGSLLSPYAELFISSVTDINDYHVAQKLALNTSAMHFIPTSQVVYRQAFFLAQNGQLEDAKKQMEMAIWSYPSNGEAHGQLLRLAETDPAHFAALLEFATQKEQEHARAVSHR